MSHVKNWQLKREMEYAYDEARPKKQWAIVFDLNKCIACQTCTLACKTTWTSGKGQEYMFWNNVETKPWGGYPLAWDLRILEKLGRQEWSAKGMWRPAALGLRPTYESDAMKRYLAGSFVNLNAK